MTHETSSLYQFVKSALWPQIPHYGRGSTRRESRERLSSEALELQERRGVMATRNRGIGLRLALTIIAALALVFSTASNAHGDEKSGTSTSSRSGLSGVYSPVNGEGPVNSNTTTRSLVLQELGNVDITTIRAVTSRVPSTLDTPYGNQESRFTERTLSHNREIRVENAPPEVSIIDGAVSLRGPQSYQTFSIAPANSTPIKSVNYTVVTTPHGRTGVKSFSHVTQERSGQIISVIHDAKIDYVDFVVNIPKGYRLKANDHRGYDLLGPRGDAEGAVAMPWAIDAARRSIPTSFSLISQDTIRQQVATQDARFPITLDPSWFWWVATAGKCAVAIAPVLITGGAALAARVPRLVLLINRLAKASKIGQAMRKIGGVDKAVVVVAKKAAQVVERAVPSWLRGKMPHVTLTSKEQALVATLWPFIIENAWDARSRRMLVPDQGSLT